MIKLQNRCSCSKISVHPKNWDINKASIKKDWYIHYRFYDPRFIDKFPNGMLRVIKGMNKFKDLSSRQQATKVLIDNEMHTLLNKGYNPITKEFILPDIINGGISESFSFLSALEFALNKKQCSAKTKQSISNCIKHVIIAAKQLEMATIPINQIKRQHLKLLLERCGQNSKRWSDGSHNKYRSYLMILFNELMEFIDLEFNPVNGLRKRKEIIKVRKVLSINERIIVNDHLKSNYYNFWRFLQIFYHSGSRITELMNVKVKDIDLVNQRCKYLVLKGQRIELYRSIKDTVLPLWKELLNDRTDEEYIFSVELKPGLIKIRPDQITKRWYRIVKKPLGIKADFYSLKHLNTDETAELLDIQAAASHNSHTSTNVTLRYYAIGEKDRQQEKIKKLANKFA